MKKAIFILVLFILVVKTSIYAATGGAGASFWTVAGVSAGAGGVTMGTNNIIGQTGNERNSRA